jgi:Flp pilus assembly protein TadG
MRKKNRVPRIMHLTLRYLTLNYGKYNTERGSSLAWTAILLAAVVLPLMSLVIDGSRLFYVRGRLQTAVDAACEDAAWSGADYRAFRDTGATKFIPNLGGVLAQARDTFDNTIGDRSRVNFTASVSIVPDHAHVSMRCSAAATVPLTVAPGAPVNIRTQAVSAIRFNR